jgi:hypothetical protein
VTADEYQARVEKIEAEYRLDLISYEKFAAGKWPAGLIPRGPKQAARKRELALAEAREERMRTLELEKLERRAAESAAAGEVEASARAEASAKPPDEAGDTGEIPFGLVEKTVRRHKETGEGRRQIPISVGGMTEWWARLILYWVKDGKPSGLWLDEHDRLCWGPAITPVWGREQGRAQRARSDSPAPVALRLPRV